MAKARPLTRPTRGDWKVKNDRRATVRTNIMSGAICVGSVNPFVRECDANGEVMASAGTSCNKAELLGMNGPAVIANAAEVAAQMKELYEEAMAVQAITAGLSSSVLRRSRVVLEKAGIIGAAEVKTT